METSSQINTNRLLTVAICYIPIFYFKLHPKFPFLFHTLMFPMFPMSSYSILQCFQHFPQSSDVFLHSDAFPTPMFLKSSCSIPCSNVFRCFPYFYRCRTFLELLWTHYHHGTFSVTSWTHFPKHHNLRSIMDSLWMQ